jgi:hypothetical protein
MIFSIAGLGISLVETVLVAFSVKQGKVMIWRDSPKEPEHTTVFKLVMFRWGLACLGLGFLLQIVSVVHK